MVVGFSQHDAVAAIERSKLHGASRGEELSSRVRGRVTRTDPVAGSALKTGSLVGYWVADGRNVVPDVSGLSRAQAGAMLQKSGFGLRAILLQSGVDVRVTHQDPPAGAPALVGSAVTITVGKRNGAWVVALAATGLLVVLLGTAVVVQRVRLAKLTRSLLSVHPSVDLDGPTKFTNGVRSEGPSVRIQASLEPGEDSTEREFPIVRREVRDD
jgi:beta-lactam-binding protein with PASTA domain